MMKILKSILLIDILMLCIRICELASNLPYYQHGLGLSTQIPLNIAHRGSSGLFPENTVQSTREAMNQGADVIEMDLCLTKDLKLVNLHESWFSRTTNVADIFPEERMNTYFINGRYITDYFTVDFTLEELKQVRTKQRMGYRNHNYDYLYEVATFEEIIATVKDSTRIVGLLAEIKDPTWVNSLDILTSRNTTFEDLIVNVLYQHGYKDRNDPILIQSFCSKSIKYVSEISPFAVQFLTAFHLSNESLSYLAKFCYGVGVSKELVIRINARNKRVGVTDLVKRVRDIGLKIHVWTLRNEDQFLAWDYQQDPYLEYEDFVLNAKVDGLINDFPGTCNRYLQRTYENDCKTMNSLSTNSKHCFTLT